MRPEIGHGRSLRLELNWTSDRQLVLPDDVNMAQTVAPSNNSGGSWLPNRWLGPVVAFACGLAIILVAFWPSWLLLPEAWGNSDTYSHGYIVAPIAIWLAWRQRRVLASLPVEPNLLGLLILFGAIGLFSIGELSEVNVALFPAIVTMLPGLVLLCFGWRVTRALIFPLAFLYFMVPFGDFLVPPLMNATADATIAALRLSGIPVYREALHFSLPTGQWSIIEACSGLRYVIAAMVLSALFAHLNFRRLWKGALFVALGLLVSVLANWARAYLIVMIGHLSHMRYGTGSDHVVYGWIFFGLVMLGIFWMGMKYADVEVRLGPSNDVGADVAVPANLPGKQEAGGTPVGGLVVGIVVLLLAVGISLLGIDGARDIEERTNAGTFLTEGLKPIQVGQIDIEPVFEGASAIVQGSLQQRGLPVQAYIAYFARQHYKGEMIRYGNGVLALDSKQWGTFARRNVMVESDGGGIEVQERLARRGTDERLIWSWYTVAGRSTASERIAKILTLRAMLTGLGDHSTVNVLEVPVEGDRVAAVEVLRREAVRVNTLVRQLTVDGRE